MENVYDYMRGPLSWLLLMSSSSFPQSDDLVSVRTPRWRHKSEWMKLSDAWGVYGCGSARRMTVIGDAESDTNV